MDCRGLQCFRMSAVITPLENAVLGTAHLAIKLHVVLSVAVGKCHAKPQPNMQNRYGEERGLKNGQGATSKQHRRTQVALVCAPQRRQGSHHRRPANDYAVHGAPVKPEPKSQRTFRLQTRTPSTCLPGSDSGGKSAEACARRAWKSLCYCTGWTTGHMLQAVKREIVTDNKRVSTTHPNPREHMELHLHRHFATHMDPSCGLRTAANHILYWIGTAKTMVPKKAQKCGNTGSPCLDKPVLGQGVQQPEA